MDRESKAEEEPNERVVLNVGGTRFECYTVRTPYLPTSTSAPTPPTSRAAPHRAARAGQPR